jgi:hypothetical protein
MTEYMQKLADVAQLIKKMDLPEYRKSVKHNTDLRWLKNNLHVKNSKHKNYQKVMDIIDTLSVG